MTTSVSDGDTTVIVTTLTGYSAEREGRNIVHTIIGTPDPSVTLREAGLRSGELEALVPTLAMATDLETLLAGALPMTLSDSEVTGVNMSFVVPDGGRITVTLDDETRDRWLVRWDFQEVS